MRLEATNLVGRHTRYSKRWKHLGPPHLLEPVNRQELKPFMDEIIACCDFRQGALYNTLPFQSDSLKREFYLALLDENGLGHAAVLTTGGKVVAANLTVRSRTWVSLGVLAHSAAFAAQSPGSTLISQLAARLMEHGVRYLDLTPGGSQYKERFANDHDEAYFVRVFAKSWTYRWSTSIEWLKLQSRRSGLTALVRQRPRWLRLSTWKAIFSVHKNAIYRHVGAGPREQTATALHVNSLEDLLKYRPPTSSHKPIYTFLRDAHTRLERGDRAYTFVANGVLLLCAWMGEKPGQVLTELGGGRLDVPSGSIILYDDYMHPSEDARAVHKISIDQRVSDAHNLKANAIFAFVPVDELAARRHFEESGFQYYGRVSRRVVLGHEIFTCRLESASSSGCSVSRSL